MISKTLGKTAVWATIMKLTSFVAVFLISTELLLRIFQILIAPNNPLSLSPAYPILTLGESTTQRLHDRSDWPSQLQELLNQKFKAVVYNEALAATTTPSIIQKVPQYLRYYRPQLVITMMGINDSPGFWQKKFVVTEESWAERHLKTYKLYKYLKAEFNELLTENRKWNIPDIPSDDLHFPDFENLAQSLITVKYKSADHDKILNEIALFLKPKSTLERAKFYNYLAFRMITYSPTVEKNFNLHKAIDFYLLTVENDARVADTINQALQMVNTTGEFQYCRHFINEARKQNIIMNDTFLVRAAFCLQDDKQEIDRLFVEAGDIYEFRSEKAARAASETYLQMASYIDKEGICWIAMEYPNREYSEAIKRVTSLGYKNVFALSNLENFRTALNTHTFEDLFTDRFGVQFGHATRYANSLIAENVLNLILKLKQENLCGL